VTAAQGRTQLDAFSDVKETYTFLPTIFGKFSSQSHQFFENPKYRPIFDLANASVQRVFTVQLNG
jgi:hypothetical protein